jgi:hypothetical protein
VEPARTRILARTHVSAPARSQFAPLHPPAALVAWLGALVLALAVAAALACAPAARATATEPFPLYDGPLKAVFVDPAKGIDTARGTRNHPVRTLAQAWKRVPRRTASYGRGWAIVLLPGTYPAKTAPKVWKGKRGTRSEPIVIKSQDGLSTVQLPPMQVEGVSGLVLIDVRVSGKSAGSVVRCVRCTDLLLRHAVVEGTGDWRHGKGPTAALTLDHSTGTYVEESAVSGGAEHALDIVASRGTRVVGSTASATSGWCVAVRAGSVDTVVESSDVHTCTAGGITIGQVSPLDAMAAPWLAYEAYDTSVVNDEVHHVGGPAYAVQGAWNAAVIHDTAYRTGGQLAAAAFSFGGHTCTAPAATCAQLVAAGGWGPAAPGGSVLVPNHAVRFYDNLFVDPPEGPAPVQHLYVAGATPVDAATGMPPSPVRADDDLQVRGNTMRSAGAPVGTGPGTGCQPDPGSSCTPDGIVADNAIDTINAKLVDPDHGRYAPGPGVWRLQTQTFTPPPFNGLGLPGGVEPSWTANRSNDASTDRYGTVRTGSKGLPGATEVEHVVTFAARHRGAGSVRFTEPWHPTCVLTECSELVEYGSWHQVLPLAAKGWRFSEWEGDCTGTIRSCWVHSDRQRAVIARYLPVKR